MYSALCTAYLVPAIQLQEEERERRGEEFIRSRETRAAETSSSYYCGGHGHVQITMYDTWYKYLVYSRKRWEL